MDNILEIKIYPAGILRERAEVVEKITEEEARLFNEMLSTMRHFSGIGLAAPQIGINKKLIVANTGEKTIRLANPELIEVKGKDKMEEGCLSVPGILVNVVRPYEVAVKGLDEEGRIVHVRATGLLARILLHEIDHLNGKLIIDHMNLWEKLKFNLKKQKK